MHLTIRSAKAFSFSDPRQDQDRDHDDIDSTSDEDEQDPLEKASSLYGIPDVCYPRNADNITSYPPLLFGAVKLMI